MLSTLEVLSSSKHAPHGMEYEISYDLQHSQPSTATDSTADLVQLQTEPNSNKQRSKRKTFLCMSWHVQIDTLPPHSLNNTTKQLASRILKEHLSHDPSRA